ncbi:MAG: hypothetical protein ACRCUZ_16385, partial [Shewanella sp.]
RLRKLGLSNRVEIISGFKHSLSKNKSESDEVTEFRRLEMLYAKCLSIRHYKPFLSVFILCIKLLLQFLGKKISRETLVSALNVIYTGRHPKCR